MAMEFGRRKLTGICYNLSYISINSGSESTQGELTGDVSVDEQIWQN
jgi:hypothetical protein